MILTSSSGARGVRVRSRRDNWGGWGTEACDDTFRESPTGEWRASLRAADTRRQDMSSLPLNSFKSSRYCGWLASVFPLTNTPFASENASTHREFRQKLPGRVADPERVPGSCWRGRRQGQMSGWNRLKAIRDR